MIPGNFKILSDEDLNDVAEVALDEHSRSSYQGLVNLLGSIAALLTAIYSSTVNPSVAFNVVLTVSLLYFAFRVEYLKRYTERCVKIFTLANNEQCRRMQIRADRIHNQLLETWKEER